MRHYTFTLLFIFLSFSQSTWSQEADSVPTIEGLFDSHELLDITISSEMRMLFRDVGDDRDYHPASLRCVVGGDTQQVRVQLRTRGNFRRQRSVCNLPPIRVKFDKEEKKGTLFHRQKKLKLVTVCQYKKDFYEQNLLLEYLTYRSYNILTDSSFRVRLARITYADTRGKIDTFVRYSFFIEGEDQMAERLGGRLFKINNVHPRQTVSSACVRMSLFQYMIGNTDWSIPNLHNIRLVGENGLTPPVAVPYDFDWSGVINAPYAIPNPKLGLSSVEERLYRGFCRSEAEFEEAFRELIEARTQIYALYNNCEMLEERNRKRVLAYYDEFYSIINNEKKRKLEIYDACRTKK